MAGSTRNQSGGAHKAGPKERHKKSSNLLHSSGPDDVVEKLLIAAIDAAAVYTGSLGTLQKRVLPTEL